METHEENQPLGRSASGIHGHTFSKGAFGPLALFLDVLLRRSSPAPPSTPAYIPHISISSKLPPTYNIIPISSEDQRQRKI